MSPKHQIYYYLLLSGTAMVFIWVLISLPSSMVITQTEKLLLAVIFILVCLFGFSSAISPRWYKRYYPKIFQSGNQSAKKQPHAFRGHHPDCRRFQTHILSIKDKVYCAGCLGLAFGCIISIGLMFIYVLYPYNVITFWYSAVLFGMVLIFLVYGETSITRHNSVVHCLINILLITAFFLIIVGILEITQNLIISLIAVLFSFLWLQTRIQLSHYQHLRICMDCPKDCKQYSA